MRLTNTQETYGLVHQLLHWTTAALILTLIPVGIYMYDMPIETPEQVADKVWLYSLHKTVGIAALFVALARIVWAIVQPHPRLLNGGLEALAAKTVHWLLYGSIVAMPVLGWLHHAASSGYAPHWWPFSQNLPFVPKDPALSAFFGTAHWVFGIVLVGSLFLHIAGAVKHAAVDKDATLKRMVPGAYGETGVLPTKKGGDAPALALALGVAVLAAGVVSGIHLYRTANDAPIVASLPAPASAGAWVIDRQASDVAITVTQIGNPVEGKFGEWQADVIFDADALDASRIDAQVAIGSLTLGDVASQAIGPDYLNAAANPTATFVSDNIVAEGEGFV
ncbi:MAG: cytochrome b/b6 domain-containing protein, partial [Pseudomonadota bacterium]